MEDFWYGMEMEWKKIASMEYGKIVFHSLPCPAHHLFVLHAAAVGKPNLVQLIVPKSK